MVDFAEAVGGRDEPVYFRERLRERLNDLFMRYQVKLKATGIGSLINLHPLSGDIRTPDDVAKADPRLRQLLYLDLLEEGYYVAGRGYMALSLVVSDGHCDGFCAAVERIEELSGVVLGSMPASPPAPRLTESWFCCAEPTAGQGTAVGLSIGRVPAQRPM